MDKRFNYLKLTDFTSEPCIDGWNDYIASKNKEAIITKYISWIISHLKNTELSKSLLSHLTQKDKNEALVICSEINNIEILKLLLKLGADKSYEDNTAILWAERINNVEIIELLK